MPCASIRWVRLDEAALHIGDRLDRAAVGLDDGHLLARPFDQLLRGQPAQKSGKQADRGQHAEAPADIGWYGKRRDVFAVGELAQYSLFRIGREDEMAAIPVFVEKRLQLFSDDEELRHGFGGRARLAHDVDERAAQAEQLARWSTSWCSSGRAPA